MRKLLGPLHTLLGHCQTIPRPPSTQQSSYLGPVEQLCSVQITEQRLREASKKQFGSLWGVPRH